MSGWGTWGTGSPPDILAPSFDEQWQVACDVPFSASFIVPPETELVGELGARIERPVTRAIVTAWVQATLSGSLYLVTLQGPVDPGPYEVVWRTNDAEPPSYEAFVPLVAVPTLDPTAVPHVDWPNVSDNIPQMRPSVDDVARLERTRTIDDNANDVGTFTSLTHPTDAECDSLIESAVDYVTAQIREQIDPVHYRQVKHLVALYVAMMIEGSYYKETAQSRADLFSMLFNNSLTTLQKRIESDLSQSLLIGGMEPWHPSWRDRHPRWLA
jgi:hypothetical protein